MSKLQIYACERGGAIVVSLIGSADIVEAERLQGYLDKTIAEGKCKVLVDLGKMVFASSMALGVLIRAHRECRKHQGGLLLANPQTAVMKVLLTTQLDHLFEIHSSVEEALAALDQDSTGAAENEQSSK